MVALTERLLLEEAGDSSFERGRGYVKRVGGLRVAGARASASIRGSQVYSVRLDWAARDLRGSCTCPHFDQGFFCKHLVALGLATIAAGHGSAEPVRERPVAAEREPLTDEAAAAAELDAMTRDVLAVRGHLDYRRTNSFARDARDLVDELESHLDGGHPDAVRPALLRAVSRLRAIMLRADDSSGLVGDVCQRAAELYARACREGHPDGTKLARWLVKFRADSPGWPELELVDFVDAMGVDGLAAYRRGVAKLDLAQRDRESLYRSDVDEMLLELADHDGDVDGAVAMLSAGEHPRYGDIVERLRAAGRESDAVAWIDRAVASGRVSGHLGASGYTLDPASVVQTYHDLGRTSDAIGVWRREFARRPEVATFNQLLEYADQVGRHAAERSWALEKALELAAAPYGTGAVLVEIALADGDLETAWSAARELGAGYRWQALADASQHEMPLEAAALHLEHLEADLAHPDSGAYPGIAKRLAQVKELYRRGGADAEFEAYLLELRATYRRRPALMSALDKRGL